MTELEKEYRNQCQRWLERQFEIGGNKIRMLWLAEKKEKFIKKFKLSIEEQKILNERLVSVDAPFCRWRI